MFVAARLTVILSVRYDTPISVTAKLTVISADICNNKFINAAFPAIAAPCPAKIPLVACVAICADDPAIAAP
jgi:hypothetical protein